MAKITTFVCDRCGRKMNYTPETFSLGRGAEPRKYDLCNECEHSIRMWMREVRQATSGVIISGCDLPLLRDGTFCDAMYIMTQREGCNFRRASWSEYDRLGVSDGLNVRMDTIKNACEKLTLEDYEAGDWMEIRKVITSEDEEDE